LLAGFLSGLFEVVGGWRGLYNEEPHKEDGVGGACSTHGDMGNAYNILMGKPKGKRLLGRPGHKLEDNIRMDHREIGWEVV
jgi:hypothetical protein